MVRPREFDEEAVLKAARDQFWRTGYAGTTMDATAGAAGLGKGSLYGAFGGKRDLFHRVFDDYCTAATDATSRALAGDDERAFERLATYLLNQAAACSEPSHRGCFLAKGAAELTEHDEVVLRRSRETLECLRQTIAADIEACQRNGDIDPTADTQQLAALLLAVVRGLEALGKAGVEAGELRSAAEAALAQLSRPRA